MVLSHDLASIMGENRIAVFWSYIAVTPDPNDCWLWTGLKNEDGYGSFYVGGNRKRKIGTHRIVWELAHGTIPKGLCICHSCDVRSCCNKNHLWLGTVAQNNADCNAKGRRLIVGDKGLVKGERNVKAKLTSAEVSEIRRLYHSGGITQQELALKYKIGRSQVSSIVCRKHWTEVENEIPSSWRVGQKGESNGRAKLTREQAQEIRSLYNTGQFSYSKLAKMFNVHMSQVQRIIKNKAWAE